MVSFLFASIRHVMQRKLVVNLDVPLVLKVLMSNCVDHIFFLDHLTLNVRAIHEKQEVSSYPNVASYAVPCTYHSLDCFAMNHNSTQYSVPTTQCFLP